VCIFALLVTPAAAAECQAPEPVCRARTQVFRIASFDPVGSAVLVGPGLLVTNRHIVADRAWAEVFLADGRIVRAEVVPSAYAGDLALLRVDQLAGRPAPEIGSARGESDLYVIGAEAGGNGVRVYEPGRVIVLPAKGKPLARLYHSAPTRPGNSGGALVDGLGRLVGIASSGGEGVYEAIPASEIATLRGLAGPQYERQNSAIGIAYRNCIEALESIRARRGDPRPPEGLTRGCVNSKNRQLFDLAGQALGRAGRLEASVAMFERSLAQDPNAINSRLGLVVALFLGRRHGAAVPHLRRLLDLLPEDARILRYAIQAGKRGGDADLARRALALLERHHPALAPPARKFLEDLL
jgi:tetratricopeptide (TPR) repeat protein